MVPMVITVPPDSVDKIKFIRSGPSCPTRSRRRGREHQRLAGARHPLEVLTGMGDTSHWNSWQIAEETVRIFIELVLQRIAEALDHGYLDAAYSSSGSTPNTYQFDIALTVKPGRARKRSRCTLPDCSATETYRALLHRRAKQKPAERIRHLLEQAIPASLSYSRTR
jgi:hypothetical protein